MPVNSFANPYIPNTPIQREEMLKTIGITSVDQLFQDIPSEFRRPSLKLPPPLSEQELLLELEAMAKANVSTNAVACFLGGGAYNHYIPRVIQHILSRGEYATAYTPYQPEVSQGTLQVGYEFQSLVCLLTGMEVANAGMYDGATALAEAALMACRLTGRDKVVALDTLSPWYMEVVKTYCQPQGISVSQHKPNAVSIDPSTATVLAQSPNYLGYLEDLETLAGRAHAQDALLVSAFDPISLGLFRPPGEHNVDIAVAEGQPLGIPLSFGGPYLGLFTCKAQHLRQMPGRLVGRTVDRRGREAFVLTLQTREQHIRRERATSNICTSEALLATAAILYMAALGKQGLRQVAELCYHKAHYAASRIQKIPGFSTPIRGTFFKEFVVQCPLSPRDINAQLLSQGILGGLDVSSWIPNGMLLCVTEVNTQEQIDALVKGLSRFSE